MQELFIQHQLGHPSFTAVSDSLFVALSILLESDCVARFPAALQHHPLAKGSLAKIQVREQLHLEYEVGLVYKTGRHMPGSECGAGVHFHSSAG